MLERSLKTLPLRVRAANANALELSRRLAGHVDVAQVFYPGLANHPSHAIAAKQRSEEHTSELQSQSNLVCRLLLEKKKLHVRHAHATYRIMPFLVYLNQCYTMLLHPPTRLPYPWCLFNVCSRRMPHVFR